MEIKIINIIYGIGTYPHSKKITYTVYTKIFMLLELIYLYFPPSFHLTVVNQETEVTSTPTRPVENVILTTKGLQERNTNVGWDDGGKIGKIIN